MLKLTLRPGELEKPLEAAARGYARVLEEAVKAGFVSIYFYPDPESMVAAAFAAAHAFYARVRPIVKPRLRPPQTLEGPALLLGYQSLQVKAAPYEHPLVAVASGGLAGSPPPGAVYVEADGSVPAALLMIALKTGVKPPKDVVALGVSGVYAGRYVLPHGRFQGLDKALLEGLEGYGLEVDVTTTLKVYKPFDLKLCDAVAATSNPYYPGLTGRPDACSEAVPGVVAGKTPASLDKDEIARTLEALMGVMESVAGEVDARAYLSGLVGFREATPRDPREALDALVYAAEATGGFSSVVASFLDPEIEYAAAEKALEEAASILKVLEGVRPRRLKGPGWARIYTVDLEGVWDRVTPTLAWRALTAVGALDRESLIAARLQDSYVISPLQAEEAMGRGAARRLADSHVVEEDGFWLKLRAQGG